ncbi:Replicative DNA helicase [Caloramator mitchellensis]|uniref:DNA 5'-3' helicase n=1 Tax=Caloramator mitchellensis TaxID=908809 RepID=A0A0R3JQX9_CALMK|nr:DnaB-like helicase C-terminal domain-containing protein [Caloramator mitchellensis]KRQ85856.1 Replicative DNA helicase [Caloramator mitchellensis]
MQPISNLYNIQAEVEVLAAILYDNNSMTEINLRAEEFFDTKNKLIYKAMQELFNKDIKIDETNLIEYFKGNLQDIGGMSYLSNLIIAKAKLDKTKVSIIKEKARLRKLYETVLRAVDEIKNNKGFDEIYFAIQREIYNIDSQDEEKLMSDKDLFSKTFDEIENNQNKKDILGLKSGIVDLDKAINGFQNGRFYIIAGRSGMGKSAAALNIVQNISKNHHVLYYSLEMPEEELGLRRAAMFSKIDTQRLERGLLNEKEWDKLIKDFNILSNQKCYTYSKAGIHIDDIIKQAKKLKMQGKLKMLVVDHIGRLNLSGLGDTIREKITNVCIILKNLAMDLDIPVIALSQLNRSPDARADKRPSLADLKESSGIEENADVVMLLYRDEYYNSNTNSKGMIEINIAKNRSGNTGIIKLLWLPQFQLIGSLSQFKEVV